MNQRLARGTAALAAVVAIGFTPAHAADVGVSISISQPGVYGRVDIGQYPQPQLVYAQPVWVQPVRDHRPQPVYMWVPPGHQKNWAKHCSRYSACGVPVYFVRDDWYHSHVDRRDDRRDDRHDEGPRGGGPGRGHGDGHPGKGHGHGKGHGRD